jgi:hypothetical protein
MQSPTELCESAFLGVIEAARAEVAALTGYQVLPQKAYDRQVDIGPPYVIMDAGRKPSVRRPQPGVHDVYLMICVATAVQVEEAASTHTAAADAVLAALNSKVDVRAEVNVGAFHLYDYFLENLETNVIETGEWETVLTLRCVCQVVAVTVTAGAGFVDSDGASFVDSDGTGFSDGGSEPVDTGTSFADSDGTIFADADEVPLIDS